MKGFISISLLCGALATAQAQDFSYQMRYDTRTETINVSVKKTDDGYTITNQQERELRTIDTDVTFTASSFRFKDSDAGTDYTAQRAGNKILVTGILKRQAVVREFSINDNPWFQSIEQALEYFTALRITKVIFWFMNADDCEIMEMEATKEKAEIITVMETSVFAQGIKVNLTGLASLFWRADYWFRCSDGRFVRYETTEGPGGPRIIIESTGEPVREVFIMTAVKTERLTKDYHLGKTRVAALKGIDLAIREGEFVTIAGPSGSGKSTLLALIGCLDSPTEGEVMLYDKSVGGLKERELNSIRLHTIGFVFQSFNLIPVLSVYENIELPLLIMPEVTRRERQERVMRLMVEVGLAAQIKQRPAELSGGQQQRVAIARALVTKPKIILADEPTANLDSKTGIAIIDLMHAINKRDHTTFIFSSHDPKIIGRADTVIYLEDGLEKKERTA